MSIYPLQAQSFTLQSGGVSIGATSITLTSFTKIDGSTITMSDLGTKAYLTIEPNNGLSEEQIVITGVTQNSNGTATLTGVSTVLFGTPYTTSSGLAKAHQGGATVVLSNTGAFSASAGFKENDETITGTWSFSAVPNSPNDPVGNDDLTRKSWVLGVVSGGTITADAMTVAGTAGETVAAGNWVYLKNDGRWWKTSASATATSEGVIIGIAQGAGTAGNPITDGVVVNGQDNATQSGLTPGSTYYLANSSGTISTTPGTVTKAVGVAVTSTAIEIDTNVFNLPVTAEKAALAGTSGTPSGSNKYVTAADAATTSTADKIVRANGSGFIDTSWINSSASAPTVQVFTSSGTWTKPAGLAGAVVELIGGGGGGGKALSGSAGSGGGGGGYCRKFYSAASLSGTESVVIGAGGGTGPTAGGNSTFKSLTASGGAAGASSAGAGAQAAGGAGGSASGGDLNTVGQSGGSSFDFAGNGTNIAMTGQGGSAAMFAGGGQNRLLSSIAATTTTGLNATSYGGGGGGGANLSGSGTTLGGTGFAGVCIITEYY